MLASFSWLPGGIGEAAYSVDAGGDWLENICGLGETIFSEQRVSAAPPTRKNQDVIFEREEEQGICLEGFLAMPVVGQKPGQKD
jgi:hypothetical protein